MIKHWGSNRTSDISYNYLADSRYFASGSEKLNVVPLPSSDLNQILPSIFSMYCLTIERPKPVPGVFSVSLALKKRVKIFFWSDLLIP